MSHCMGDRALWLMFEGEASGEDRTHIASCTRCTSRLHRLEGDLRRIRAVLIAPPPPQVVPTRRRLIHVGWMTPAVGLATMLILIWVGLWWQPFVPPMSPTSTGQESVWPFIEGASAALFTTGDSGVDSTPDQLTDLADLQAALAGEWPCEGQSAFVHVTCDDGTFALLLGGL